MMHHVGKDLSGVFMVTAQLRASVVMRKCNDLLHSRIGIQFLFELLHDVLSHSVHATYSRDDPEFIADSGTAVCPAVTFEGRLHRSGRRFCQVRKVCILQKSFKIGLEIGMVHQTALRDGIKKMSYREAVLYDILPLGKILQGHLMAGRNPYQ